MTDLTWLLPPTVTLLKDANRLYFTIKFANQSESGARQFNQDHSRARALFTISPPALRKNRSRCQGHRTNRTAAALPKLISAEQSTHKTFAHSITAAAAAASAATAAAMAMAVRKFRRQLN